MMPFWDSCTSHIPEQHSSSKDTFLLLLILILYCNAWLTFTCVRRLTCLVKGHYSITVAFAFKRASLSVIVYIVVLRYYFMLIMSLVCRIVWCFVCVCAYRSVSTCLSLCFRVAELSGGPRPHVSPQDSGTVLISELFFCVAAFVMVFVICLY